MNAENKSVVLPDEVIISRIYSIRGHKIMFDKDLAQLYGVATKVLKQQVKRNIDRFPDDFMFILTQKEFEDLRSQIVTSSWGGTRYMPMAFTEQGVAMLSSILNSNQAIQVNIQIIRTFTQLRALASRYDEIMDMILELEDKYDSKFKEIYKALNYLLNPKIKPGKIGYKIK